MIRFFSEHIDYQPSTPEILKKWLADVVRSENGQLGTTNFIFCNDEYLLELNKKYLGHHAYTDILTFDQSDSPGLVSADIYISIERVNENAHKFKVKPQLELKRVMVHGILHLLGYNDQTTEQQQEMRKKEQAYLSLYP